MKRDAFTLIELLVVIAVISILAAILFPVLSRAKEQSKKATCISNLSQIGLATAEYLADNDSRYPQTRQTSANPAVDDAAGNIDEPVYGSPFDILNRSDSNALEKIFACPTDPDPFGQACNEADPDAPSVTSYLTNGYFVFGLSESQVPAPAQTINLAERRSTPVSDTLPYCDNIYHPWFNSSSPDAPENEMDPLIGAIATIRHSDLADYGFADSHVKALSWGETFSPPAKNNHILLQP